MSNPRLILTSHSIDNTFDYCPRKFEFLNIYDRRPPRDSGYAASVGTALHEGVQAWLVARAEGMNENGSRAKGYLALLKAFPWDAELEQKMSTRSIHNTLLMLKYVFEQPFWDEWELLRVADKGWAIEVPFLIKHTSLGEFTLKNTGERCLLATQGKIDWIMRHYRTGAIRTFDLKTTTTPTDLIRSEYTYSGQQVGYSHVLHAMLGVQPDQFDVQYLVARFSATDPPEIQIVPFNKADDLIDDYWAGKIDRLARMKAYAEAGWFPRTNGGCNAWGRECSCFDICRSRDQELIERWFQLIEAEPQQPYNYWVEMEV